jgi:hypothetical protein
VEGWKSLPVKNTLAYYGTEAMFKRNSCRQRHRIELFSGKNEKGCKRDGNLKKWNENAFENHGQML